jgi:hypothetical protein
MFGNAQPPDPSHFTYTRIYSAPDTETHFQQVTVDLAKRSFAPPAPPLCGTPVEIAG